MEGENNTPAVPEVKMRNRQPLNDSSVNAQSALARGLEVLQENEVNEETEGILNSRI